MTPTAKYLTKIFKTSPGKFTKRETQLIKHFLTIKENIEKPIGIDTLHKALNFAKNNVKWILKVFLIANVQSKRAKSLNQLTTTVQGRVFGQRKIMLKVERGAAVLIAPVKKHRFGMFPDRTGTGAQYVYQVEAIKGKRFKKDGLTVGKKGRSKKVKRGKSKWAKSANLKNYKSLIKKEIKARKELAKLHLLPLEPIDGLILIIDKLNDIIYPNKGSLDILESGDWRRICTTARRKGDKLIVDFIVKLSERKREVRTYEFNVSDALEGEYSTVPDDLVWVFDMFNPWAKALLKYLRKLKTKKVKGLDENIIMLIIEYSNTYKNKFQKYWNSRFATRKKKGVWITTSAEPIEEDLIEMGSKLKQMLENFKDAFLSGKDPASTVEPLLESDYFGEDDGNELTDLDIERYVREVK